MLFGRSGDGHFLSDDFAGGFADGDAVPILPTDRWFSTYEEAVAALPELLNQDE